MLNLELFEVSLDSGAIIIDFNDKASEISGYKREEVIGKNWFEIFIPNEDMVEILEVFSNLFYGKNLHWEYTNDIVCKDGKIKTIKWNNKIILDKNKNHRLIYSLGTEITSTKNS